MKIHLESQPLPNRGAAEKWMADYLNCYSPLGYGTRLDIRENTDGTWTVHGSRYNSAD